MSGAGQQQRQVGAGLSGVGERRVAQLMERPPGARLEHLGRPPVRQPRSPTGRVPVEAGGSAFVFGHSSGAVLALEAAANGLPIARLALYEPPFIVDEADDGASNEIGSDEFVNAERSRGGDDDDRGFTI